MPRKNKEVSTEKENEGLHQAASDTFDDFDELDYEEVSNVAREIWLFRGMPEGIDEDIWYEAERRIRHPEMVDAESKGIK